MHHFSAITEMKIILILLSLLYRVHGALLRSAHGDNFCKNNDSFNFRYDGRSRGCQWVRDVFEGTRQEVCQRSNVRENCEYSCGICCEDNPSYTLQIPNGKTKSCIWIGNLENELEKHGYWCGFEWEGTGQKVDDVCPVSCKNCPIEVKVFGAAAPEILKAQKQVEKVSFPYAIVFGSVGGGLLTVLAIGMILLRRNRYKIEEDDISFVEFVMTPSEWLA